MIKPKTAIYPGTFDPITFGHIDIIKRAMQIIERLVIAVAQDNNKNPLFSLKQRVSMVEREVKAFDRENKIEVIGFNGLLVNFAQKKQAKIIIRGLRAVSDFEYEFQMSGMNSKLDDKIQTIFLPASEATHFIASKLVKEVKKLGGDVSAFVSLDVQRELDKIFQNNG